MVVILFGVSGAGKTVIGRLLAQELRWQFYDADDFHSRHNIEKMHSGRPLTDDDRLPWLNSLRDLIEHCLRSGENAVLACSALKKRYRVRIRAGGEVRFAYLQAEYPLIADRLRHRTGHFMDPKLLKSQFDALEQPDPDENVIVVQARLTPEEIVAALKSNLGLSGRDPIR